jgi:hypothetical protein
VRRGGENLKRWNEELVEELRMNGLDDGLDECVGSGMLRQKIEESLERVYTEGSFKWGLFLIPLSGTSNKKFVQRSANVA